MGGPVLLRGIAQRVPGAAAHIPERPESSPPILERVVFVSDERDVEPVARYHRALAIALDDGERVRVEIPEGGAIDFESVPDVRTGAWSELRDTPIAHGFHPDAVPPFARV